MNGHRRAHRIALRAPAFALLLVLACGDDEATSPRTPVDETPPTVVSVAPDDGSGDVPVRARVRVRFSEPVRADPSGGGPFALDRGGVPVEGRMVREDPTVLAFAPEEVLELATSYSVRVTTGIIDTAGNPLASSRGWGFTTGGLPPPSLDESAVLERIRVLAHDSMAGRGSGTADELRAARYVASELEALGLEPGAPGYLQSFDVPPERIEGRTGVTSQNVVGVLPGEGDLADDWLVVGAHYDHEGTRETSPGTIEIFNGADDNASGTAVMLEIARELSRHVERGGTADGPRRSVMFVAFGAEELGLVGSQHYCENPTVPLDAVAAMVNFDMVGRLRGDELFVIGLWTSASWDDFLAGRNEDGLALVDRQNCQSCSDYACFRWNRRPAIWFFTGFHPQAHTPDDDIGLIDGAGAVKVGNLGIRTLLRLAIRDRRPAFGSVAP